MSEAAVVGDFVRVAAQPPATDVRRGILRYIGPTAFADGVWCGVELVGSVGRNNGSIAEKKYFDCLAGQGIFVRPDTVAKISDGADAVAAARAEAEGLREGHAALTKSLAEERRIAAEAVAEKQRYAQLLSEARSSAVKEESAHMQPLQEELKATNLRLAELKVDLTRAKEEATRSAQSLRDANALIKKKEEETSTLKGQVAAAQKNAQETQWKLEKATAEMHALEASANAERHKRRSAFADEAMMADLQKLLAERELTVSGLRQSIATQETEAEKMRELHAEVLRLKGTVTELEERNGLSVSALEAAQENISNLELEVELLTEQKLSLELRMEEAVAGGGEGGDGQALVALRHECATLREKLQGTEEQRLLLQQRLEEGFGNAGSDDANSLEAMEKELILREELQAAKEEAATAVKSAASAADALAASMREVDEQKAQVEDLCTQLQSLLSEFDEEQKSHEQLSKALYGRIAHLEEELDSKTEGEAQARVRDVLARRESVDGRNDGGELQAAQSIISVIVNSSSRSLLTLRQDSDPSVVATIDSVDLKAECALLHELTGRLPAILTKAALSIAPSGPAVRDPVKHLRQLRATLRRVDSCVAILIFSDDVRRRLVHVLVDGTMRTCEEWLRHDAHGGRRVRDVRMAFVALCAAALQGNAVGSSTISTAAASLGAEWQSAIPKSSPTSLYEPDETTAACSKVLEVLEMACAGIHHHLEGDAADASPLTSAMATLRQARELLQSAKAVRSTQVVLLGALAVSTVIVAACAHWERLRQDAKLELCPEPTSQDMTDSLQSNGRNIAALRESYAATTSMLQCLPRCSLGDALVGESGPSLAELGDLYLSRRAMMREVAVDATCPPLRGSDAPLVDAGVLKLSTSKDGSDAAQIAQLQTERDAAMSKLRDAEQSLRETQYQKFAHTADGRYAQELRGQLDAAVANAETERVSFNKQLAQKDEEFQEALAQLTKEKEALSDAAMHSAKERRPLSALERYAWQQRLLYLLVLYARASWPHIAPLPTAPSRVPSKNVLPSAARVLRFDSRATCAASRMAVARGEAMLDPMPT